MKRLTALVLSAMLVAGTLTACGEDDESSSGKAATTGTASSTAESGTAEATTEGTTGTTTEAATTEKTTSEKTTAAETTAEITSEPETASDAAEDSIVGKWRNIYCITDEIWTFEEDGMFSIVTDYTPYLKIEGNKATYCGIEGDVKYEDGTLSIVINGETDLQYSKFYELESDNEMDGLYYEVYDKTGAQSSKPTGEYYRIAGGKIEHIIDGRYTVDGNKLTENAAVPDGDPVVTEYTLEFKNGQMIVTSEYDSEIVCERVE